MRIDIFFSFFRILHFADTLSLTTRMEMYMKKTMLSSSDMRVAENHRHTIIVNSTGKVKVYSLDIFVQYTVEWLIFLSAMQRWKELLETESPESLNLSNVTRFCTTTKIFCLKQLQCLSEFEILKILAGKIKQLIRLFKNEGFIRNWGVSEAIRQITVWLCSLSIFLLTYKELLVKSSRHLQEITIQLWIGFNNIFAL